jgi:hypothetical protein
VDHEEWESSRDGSHPSTPMSTTGKRKSSDDRQPESPPEVERQLAPSNWNREKHFRAHPVSMETDSPASYPKDMMVSSEEQRYRGHQSYHDGASSKGSVSTPVLANEYGGNYGGYEHPSYRPSNNYQGYESGHYNTPPRNSRGHYEMEAPPSSYYAPPAPAQADGFIRPRRWACDYCSIATFVSYEEACSHEDACARQYHERYGGRPHPSRGPVPQYDSPPADSRAGLGALFHAGQEMAPPPGRHQQMWGRGPPMPHLPPDHQQGHYPPPHHGHHQPHDYHAPPRYPSYHGYSGSEGLRRPPYDQPNQKRMLLQMPTDTDSLSDRQCYVRSEMVEIFAATNKDVSARHSKGAQKLIEGQVGIRCLHCAHLRPRDRAERAVCYPSSISRIYQTVADMQRFHFEQCREIPPEVRKIYKSLKTTRPRGVGSPQTYWIQSAELLDLIDSKNGIRFSTDVNHEETTAP